MRNALVPLSLLLLACDPGVVGENDAHASASDGGGPIDAHASASDGGGPIDAAGPVDAASNAADSPMLAGDAYVVDAPEAAPDAPVTVDAFSRPAPTCEGRLPFEANTYVEIPDVPEALPDPCTSPPDPTLDAHYFELVVPAGHHVRRGLGRVTLRPACACGGEIDTLWYQNRTPSEERFVLSVQRQPGGDPVSAFVSVVPTPPNGACTDAASAGLPFVQSDLTDTGTTSSRFDRCDGTRVESRALWYQVEVPAGRTLVVSAEDEGPRPRLWQRTRAFVLSGCALAAGDCLARNRITDAPTETRYANSGVAPRVVLVAVEQGSLPRFTLRMTLE